MSQMDVQPSDVDVAFLLSQGWYGATSDVDSQVLRRTLVSDGMLDTVFEKYLRYSRKPGVYTQAEVAMVRQSVADATVDLRARAANLEADVDLEQKIAEQRLQQNLRYIKQAKLEAEQANKRAAMVEPALQQMKKLAEDRDDKAKAVLNDFRSRVLKRYQHLEEVGAICRDPAPAAEARAYLMHRLREVEAVGRNTSYLVMKATTYIREEKTHREQDSSTWVICASVSGRETLLSLMRETCVASP